MTIELNTALPVSDFAAQPTTPATKSIIRFVGGVTLEPQIDPTKGTASTCAMTGNLVAQLSAALAPFQPLFTILDFVAQIGNCFLLVTEAITNPFKIPDLVQCLPGLVQKLNAILALVPIPVIPQGIAALITMIVDVIRFVAQQIDCVVQQLEAIKAQLAEISRAIDTLNEGTDDPVQQEGLQALIDAGTANAEEATATALSALGPIARVLCTIRSLIAILPGGKAIAREMSFPDPTQIDSIDDAIAALGGTRDALLGVVGLIEAIGSPFGAPLAVPEGFASCPLDASGALDDAEDEDVQEPVIRYVTTAAGVQITDVGGATSAGDPDFVMLVHGSGFSSSSAVYWNTSPVEDAGHLADSTIVTGLQQIRVALPETLRRNPGKFFLMVVNVPAGAGQQFAGVGDSTPATKVSEQFELEVL